MTLMMTSAQVVETSVNVTNNSPSRDYSHPDDQTTQTIVIIMWYLYQYSFKSENIFISCFQLYLAIFFQGVEGKYLLVKPLKDQFSTRSFTIDKTLGKHQTKRITL